MSKQTKLKSKVFNSGAKAEVLTLYPNVVKFVKVVAPYLTGYIAKDSDNKTVCTIAPNKENGVKFLVVVSF